MKILKWIFLVILVLVAIPLLLALFVKKDYSLEREIVINRPSMEVYNYIKLLKNQDEYSKWAKMDPNMKKDYEGIDGTVGFTSKWDSEDGNVGKGEQEIVKMNEGKRIDYQIRFIKPFASVAPSYLITEPVGENQTKVKWGFSGSMPYPMNFMRVFMDIPGMIGNDLDTGLANLKKKLEK